MTPSRQPPGGGRRLPTMKDVARRAGVHPSTVSLALRNNPDIPEETRRRIREIAVQIGYHPDPVLDAFNANRLSHQPLRSAPAIAYISDLTPRPSCTDSSAQHETYLGAREAAERLGFVLDRFFVGSGGLPPARLSQIMEARAIDCAIVASFSRGIAELSLNWPRLVALKIESFHVQPDLDIITTDHLQASRLAVARLRALGYRRIGLVLAAGEDQRLRQLARSGYLTELAQTPNQPAIPPLELTVGPAAVAGQLSPWLAAHEPDAVIGPTGELLAHLHRAQSASASHLGFAALDRAGASDAVAGVDSYHRLVGHLAVELLASRRRINQRGLPSETSVTFLPVSWYDGATAPAVHEPVGALAT